ncbi:hypothetical protein N431DRAFT_95199 [Stipitochalara longipes BDJ]|nr:hypothetical protein N431DRAFT_95199 [Stipitochalara longipes BDJ]
MSSNREKTSSRTKPRRSKAEEEAEEARLDALIAAPPKPSPQQAKSVLPSRLDKPRTEQKSIMPSRLDKSAMEKSKLPSKLDESRMEKSKLPSRLDQSRKEEMISRLDEVNQEIMASRLDKFSQKAEQPEVGRSAVKTKFTNPHDIEMASRQTKYDSLPPQKQQEQEEWAQQKIAQVGVCPAGFSWIRVPGGYNCHAGGHWMSDELLVEGKGRYYTRKIHRNPQEFLKAYPGPPRDFTRWETMREVGFSKGTERFDGPHECGGGFFSPGVLQSPYGPRYDLFGQSNQNQHQGPSNPYDLYGNNQRPSAFGRRPYR